MLIERIERAFVAVAVWCAVLMCYLLWLVAIIGICVTLFHFARKYW